MIRCTLDCAVPQDSKCAYCCRYCDDKECECRCPNSEKWNKDEIMERCPCAEE